MFKQYLRLFTPTRVPQGELILSIPLSIRVQDYLDMNINGHDLQWIKQTEIYKLKAHNQNG